MAFFYEPPSWRNVATIERSLRYSIKTYGCVYRTGGQFFYTRTAGVGQLDGADLVIVTAQAVDAATAAQLQSLSPNPALWPDGVGTVTNV